MAEQQRLTTTEVVEAGLDDWRQVLAGKVADVTLTAADIVVALATPRVASPAVTWSWPGGSAAALRPSGSGPTCRA